MFVQRGPVRVSRPEGKDQRTRNPLMAPRMGDDRPVRLLLGIQLANTGPEIGFEFNHGQDDDQDQDSPGDLPVLQFSHDSAKQKGQQGRQNRRHQAVDFRGLPDHLVLGDEASTEIKQSPVERPVGTQCQGHHESDPAHQKSGKDPLAQP